MKRGLDTSALVYAHVPSLADHAAVRGYLVEQLRSDDVVLVITPVVLHELVHVITDPRRFEPAVSMPEALAVARLYLGSSNVECVSVDEATLGAAFALMERHGLGRKRIADTLFAASLLRHGATELITCNPSDFTVFSGLRVIDPRKR